jgi:tetratricopeptide (TPR) repeat protein
MSEKAIQITLFIFAGALLFLGFDMADSHEPWMGVTIYGLVILLLIWTSVGPSTIKTFTAKWDPKGGGQIRFDRHQATEEERELVEEFAQDQPSPEIEEEGQKFIKKARQRSPDKRSAEDYLALAADKWRAKDYDVALENIYSGLALQPEDIRIKATFVHRKANNFASLGLKEQAEKFFKEAINIDPSFSWPHNNLGLLYRDQGMHEEEEDEFRKAIALDPDNEKSPFNLGLLYERQDKFELAKVQFERTLKINPDFEKAKSGLERVIKKLEE